MLYGNEVQWGEHAIPVWAASSLVLPYESLLLLKDSWADQKMRNAGMCSSNNTSVFFVNYSADALSANITVLKNLNTSETFAAAPDLGRI